MARERISLLTLTPGEPPQFKKDGRPVINPIWDLALTNEECQHLVFSVLFKEEQNKLLELGSLRSNVKLTEESDSSNVKLPNQSERFILNARHNSGITSGTVSLIGPGDA
jgi:Tfp pilus assembly ATPase PilU